MIGIGSHDEISQASAEKGIRTGIENVESHACVKLSGKARLIESIS
jgi:hypothetical protein